jgi:hypothetical protein
MEITQNVAFNVHPIFILLNQLLGAILDLMGTKVESLFKSNDAKESMIFSNPAPFPFRLLSMHGTSAVHQQGLAGHEIAFSRS